MQITARQQREIEYHKGHATRHRSAIAQPLSYDVIRGARWWNAYWTMFSFIRSAGIEGRRVLVVGCGFGEDALRIAKLGGRVDAFDLSPHSLEIAKTRAAREGLDVTFSECPAENLPYEDGTFDFIVARDILHHVDVCRTLSEMSRVSKPGATWIINEIYSHSLTEIVRRSPVVEKFLYPAMRNFVYMDDTPYITEDERKLTEKDIAAIEARFHRVEMRRHFNAAVTRIVPDKYTALAQIDQALLLALRPVARFLCGRILLAGRTF